MLMTVAHRARLRPRSHSPVVRWIRNPLSSDSGVRIPLSAPIEQNLGRSVPFLVFMWGGSNCSGVFAPPTHTSCVEGVGPLHQLRDVILHHAWCTRFKQGTQMLVHVGHGAKAEREGLVQHLGQALSRARVLALPDCG